MKRLSLTILLVLSLFISSAQENLYRLSDDKTYVSYIDKTGKLIFKADLKSGEIWDFGDYRNGFLTVNYSKTKKSVIFDNRGNKTFETDALYFFYGHKFGPDEKFMVMVQSAIKGQRDPRGPEGVIDEKGNFIVPLDRANDNLTYVGQRKFVRMYGPNYIDLVDDHGKFVERYSAVNFYGKTAGFHISENLLSFIYREADFNEIIPPKNTFRYSKYGFMDINKNVIIAPKFERVNRFSEGFATVVTANNDYTIINKKGDLILDSSFDNYTIPTRSDDYEPRFVNGLANICVVAKDDEEKKIKCGFIDSLSRWIIKPEYTFATQFSGGLAMVVDKNQKTLFINKKGEVILSGFWDDREHRNCWWDKNVIFVRSINTYFNHKGQKLGMPATLESVRVNSASQLSGLSEKELLKVETINFSNEIIPNDLRILQKVYKCKNLKELYLGGRELEEGDISFQEIYKLGKLEYLSIEFSKIRSLPNGISQLKNLKKLSLNHTEIEKLPDDIRLLKLDLISIDGTPLSMNEKAVKSLKTHVKKIYHTADEEVMSTEPAIRSQN